MYTIGIVGAGYLGSRMAAYFRSKNQKVWAVSRHAERLKPLESLGIEGIAVDLLNPGDTGLPPAHFIVFTLAPDDSNEESYRKTYIEAVGRVIDRMRKNPRPFMAVYVSSTGLYGASQTGWVDESITPAPESEKNRILIEAEQQVLESGFPAAVLRLSGIYGPGRNILQRLKDKKTIETEDRYVNLIHVDDAAEMMPQFFKSAKPGEIYLGSDDGPAKRSEIYAWLQKEAGCDLPIPVSAASDGRRYRNQKLKSLGIQLKYPTFREGYRMILENRKAAKA